MYEGSYLPSKELFFFFFSLQQLLNQLHPNCKLAQVSHMATQMHAESPRTIILLHSLLQDMVDSQIIILLN